jgi:hypothetical protein
MKTNRTFMSIALLGLLLISCKSNETSDSDKVAQSEIYQSYFVEYDASQNEFEASASFRFGGENGTTLRLVDKSNIAYNNNPMNAQTSGWTGTSYVYKRNGAVGVEHTFLYVNNDKESFKNTIPLMPAEPMLKNTTISKSKGVVISWTGMPLSSKDKIEILISDSSQTHYFSPEIIGATSLTLKSTDLLPVKTGNGELSIVRRVTLSLQNGKPIGGVIGSEYKSKRIPVEIRP